ncbi:DNA polymerase III subunit gamma/tau [Mycoplasma todarodis]|uniref:DNA polymerase III subunit gamma/tau n=1 Tax=Mycoplasma todarodis TaxID=1937191 RepID=UPI003B34C4A0
MSYKALYRTHRPTNFDEIKGQDHITTTLKNIIKSEKVSHAYLFSGPRGTGKTSAAKVFANVLNCKNLSEDLKPCLKCGLCLEAKKGSSMDIIEIDAASNNGVAEIRELRDNVRYAPSNAKYKIYIIDEVHMLSKGAFNALLKTLEEPPKHAIFILATTEPHKIPVTILSRTQRFNFRRVEDSVLVSHLIEVLDKEGLKYDKSSIKLIAKLANGGLRDALSIADQASSYTNGGISFEAISQVFGIVSLESQVDIINFAASKNVDGLLSLINKFIDGGIDLTRLSMSLIDIIKDFIIFNKTGQTKLLEVLNEEQVGELSITVDSAYNMLDILVELITQLSRSEYPRQAFELAMLKLTKTAENVVVMPKTSPVLENKEPAFTAIHETKAPIVEEKVEEIAMPEPTPELQAPIINGDSKPSLFEEIQKEEVIQESQVEEPQIEEPQIEEEEGESLLEQLSKPKKEILNDPTQPKYVPFINERPVVNKVEPVEPTPEPKIEMATAPSENIQFEKTDEIPNVPEESSDSLMDLFSTQELKEKVPTEETIIDMEEIESSTQVISADLEKTSHAEEIEEDITTTQEIQINAYKEEKVADVPMANEAEEPADLLSLFTSDATTQIQEPTQVTNSVSDIINLLVQSDKAVQAHVKKSWTSIISYAANSRYSEYASLLDSARLISSGKDFILVSSKDASICTRINEVKFKRRFVELVKHVFGETKNVFAITRDQFIDVKERYTVLAKSNSLPQPQKIMVPSLGEQEKTKAHKLGEDLFGELFSA